MYARIARSGEYVSRRIFRIPLARPELLPVYPPLAFSEGVMPPTFNIDVRWGDRDFLYGVAGSAIYRTRIATGEISHVAGAFEDIAGLDGVGNRARFLEPKGMRGDGKYLYVMDAFQVRRIDLETREVSTFATGEVGAVGGAAEAGAMWGDGTNLYVSDLFRHALFRISLATREVVRFAGGPTVQEFQDGTTTHETTAKSWEFPILLKRPLVRFNSVLPFASIGFSARHVSGITDVHEVAPGLFSSRRTVAAEDLHHLVAMDGMIWQDHPYEEDTPH